MLFLLLKKNLVFEISLLPLHCYGCVNLLFQWVKCIFLFHFLWFPNSSFCQWSFIELQYWNQNLLCPLLSLSLWHLPSLAPIHSFFLAWNIDISLWEKNNCLQLLDDQFDVFLFMPFELAFNLPTFLLVILYKMHFSPSVWFPPQPNRQLLYVVIYIVLWFMLHECKLNYSASGTLEFNYWYLCCFLYLYILSVLPYNFSGSIFLVVGLFGLQKYWMIVF